ncbi:hypothetical protein [Halobacillus karajensis]|uniref:hypothetical protein n=1 Tax=Halobacillus karajensis TaxID=195088 RepID=UPI00045C5300|nr:hypothetical protein [Halobacillus karajensis]CDQ21740.1 hypothetical protein BN982_04149 [Halobacillus karajensis]
MHIKVRISGVATQNEESVKEFHSKSQEELQETLDAMALEVKRNLMKMGLDEESINVHLILEGIETE